MNSTGPLLNKIYTIVIKFNCIWKKKVKSAYEPSGQSGQSLSQFL